MIDTIHAEAVRKMICYYYLVAFCPPEEIQDLKRAARGLRGEAAKQSGMTMKPFINAVLPEVAWRIVAFQQATRQPEAEVVQKLAAAMKTADSKPDAARSFQALMAEVAAHPGRAKKDNRLHRSKGCGLCEAPCQYGFFTLVSEPVFKRLLALFKVDNQEPAEQRNPVNVLWTFTTTHLWEVMGVKDGYIRADHLGNLSYCLLQLATARSRFPFQEKHMRAYQAMNQHAIHAWRPARIDVNEPS